MRFLIIFFIFTICDQAMALDATIEVDDSKPFNPIEEAEFLNSINQSQDFQILFQFPQTHWNECRSKVTGNYTGYNCSKKRNISVILNEFLQSHMHYCVAQGLNLNNQIEEIHITHVGILGDPNHSPRSLHSEARAIDIRSLRVNIQGEGWRAYKYSQDPSQNFYEKFRGCWGKVLYEFNKCPFYNGNPRRTGSIGRENSRHRNHLHLSVPYCYNYQYGPYYYQR